jgi:hypothetical protein
MLHYFAYMSKIDPFLGHFQKNVRFGWKFFSW